MTPIETDSYRQLWSAVLIQAIADLKTTAGRSYYDHNSRTNVERIRDNARRWFASDAIGTGSFLWVCQMLSMSPGGIRERIRRHIATEEIAHTMRGPVIGHRRLRAVNR